VLGTIAGARHSVPSYRRIIGTDAENSDAFAATPSFVYMAFAPHPTLSVGDAPDDMSGVHSTCSPAAHAAATVLGQVYAVDDPDAEAQESAEAIDVAVALASTAPFEQMLPAGAFAGQAPPAWTFPLESATTTGVQDCPLDPQAYSGERQLDAVQAYTSVGNAQAPGILEASPLPTTRSDCASIDAVNSRTAAMVVLSMLRYTPISHYTTLTVLRRQHSCLREEQCSSGLRRRRGIMGIWEIGSIQ
jgi:hypothetical protein